MVGMSGLPPTRRPRLAAYPGVLVCVLVLCGALALAGAMGDDSLAVLAGVPCAVVAIVGIRVGRGTASAPERWAYGIAGALAVPAGLILLSTERMTDALEGLSVLARLAGAALIASGACAAWAALGGTAQPEAPRA
jgi:uncharacterized membrane protein HdeD (DUF308 family)